MKIYALFLFLVGCSGVQWKPLNDFRDTFKEYSAAAVDTISSIQHSLDNSRKESDSFFNDTFGNHPVIARIAGIRTKDKCFTRFINEDELRISFQIQMYQLQIPLYMTIVDIWERLNNINSSLDIYQSITESKYRSCKSVNGSCLEETNAWLESSIKNLSCAIHSNCLGHSIRKRDVCDGYQCKTSVDCIPVKWLCDDLCDCVEGCDDEDHCSPPTTASSSTTTTTSAPFTITTTTQYPITTTKPPSSTPKQNPYTNCSIDEGDFLCNNSKCIGLEQVCDGYNDCGDSSDESDLCKEAQCSPECGKKGGVCLRGPEGAKCLYECPPGTYETVKGCSPNPEPPLASLQQVLEDTPRLRTRYAARLNYLKTKTLLALSKSLREVVKCKKDEFTSLSRVFRF